LSKLKHYRDTTNIYALNATTDIKLWNYMTAGDVASSLAVVNGVAYFGRGRNVYTIGNE
jgi:outer membrane protein assembly factor BamB